jgi:catalase
MTAADAAAVQAKETGAHTKDLYDAIERGEHPEWELCVQMMDDHDHPELDWTRSTTRRSGPRTTSRSSRRAHGLDRTPGTSSPRASRSPSARACSSTAGLLDDKMLVGRTFSYSDTQRYRVGPNYLQLPVNQAKAAEVRTNQRDGRWPTTRTRPARTRTSTTSRRSSAACARPRTPRTTSRARSSRAA